ncbi:MAG: nucleotidyltransferase domain-containing protein [Desulfuromonadales bacterium]|nr:nucleotidyltransferase domain-containing protein [Desulfuromonadales bacterium]
MIVTTEAIHDELARIEREYNVRVLYAVESGSRAWGFASRDSDYDVRFVYLHPLEWYLSINEKRDVIEEPISGLLDVSGWDLRKALGLFRKSNPPLLEWLGSPIVYVERHGLAERMRDLLKRSFSPLSCLHHYMHMAQGNYREYLRGETVRIKKYFYVLRPILACSWIEKHRTMPPTEFAELYADAELSPELTATIEELLRRKLAGEELDTEPRIAVLNDYLDERIGHFSAIATGMERGDLSVEVLDRLFVDMLHEVWQKTARE